MTQQKPLHKNVWQLWEFPGSPVVRTPRSHCQGPWAQSLVGELRSSKPHSVAKKKKKKKNVWQLYS